MNFDRGEVDHFNSIKCLKVGPPYPADALATVTGYCQAYNSLSCEPFPPKYRGVAAINIRDPLAQGQIVYYPEPNNNPPSVDTRDAGTTKPDSANWTFAHEGVRTLRYRLTVGTSSLCNEGIVHVHTDREFIVTKCIPQFQRNSQGAIVHLVPNPNPPNVTYVYVPPGAGMNAQMRAGIVAGVEAWNQALSGSAGTPVFQITETPCGGPYCVKTEQDNISTDTKCAIQSIDVAQSGGVVQTTITFPTVSSGWPLAFNTRLAAHELGHLLGLAEGKNCPSAASLMRPAPCGAKTGYPTSPQPSDELPVKKTTYGQTPAVTCPAD
jgi:hypothetical protein